MPYLLISTQIRMECGPTIVGDVESDKDLMEYLGATLQQMLGNNFKEWRTPKSPRVVLDLLERRGWRVVGMTGIGQTCAWTLHKPLTPQKKQANGHQEKAAATNGEPAPQKLSDMDLS
ncbi:GTP cyclohydrolase 1 feedback regulatory protein-like [Branchiostoma floridae]|uniref:GTP cyclohydrolase 1 feedback regulatory protein n=1 Tax=Branchiostoma floridae TaxID=7739 RepID=C3Z3N9_BRAFL|nr:GTP cyclohydrolase 1 feedback regulatory protein-like [Branchiostoma floridae]|eukprot:XP_002596791.1 hypothetical protein BRAFLDRAFT_120480 [Branchiostoma floridae]